MRELGWTPSEVVREGLRILEASYLRRKKRGIIGLGKFESGVKDLGSNKKTSAGLWALKPVLLDTGVIVALLDRSERFAPSVRSEQFEKWRSPLVTCEAVIAESCYLLRNLPGAAEAVIENVSAGIFQVPFQLSREAAGIKQVLRKYRDRRIDLADACLIRLADQFETAGYSHAGPGFRNLPLGQEQSFSNAAEQRLAARLWRVSASRWSS